MQEGLVSDVGYLLVQVAHDGNILRSRGRCNQRASLLETFIDIDWLAPEMQLPRVGHRECEQPLHYSRQFLQFVVNRRKRLSVFLRSPRLGKYQLRFAVEHGERGAQLVGGVGDELT